MQKSTSIIALLASVMLASVAQLLFRGAMQTIGVGQSMFALNDVTNFSLGFAAGVALAVGITLYAGSMLCWIVALVHLKLSLAYPLMSISYVIVYVAAVSLPGFHESASLPSITGVILILFGVYIIGSEHGRPA